MVLMQSKRQSKRQVAILFDAYFASKPFHIYSHIDFSAVYFFSEFLVSVK